MTSTGNMMPKNRRALPPAALAAMGVVFGDIGTSPLYTLQVAVKAANPAGTISPEAVLGIVSLIFWSLVVVISIKYAGLIMRANNHGEGGILALLALISPQNAKRNGWRAAMVIVLMALFLIQHKGTSWIGRLFGPIMLLWFIVIGALGIVGIARAPAILGALSPVPAITYLQVAVARGQIAACNLAQVTYFTGHETIIPTSRRSAMARWRKVIFALMHHNAQQPGAYFNIPSAQIIEIGVEFQI